MNAPSALQAYAKARRGGGACGVMASMTAKRGDYGAAANQGQ